MEVPIFAVKLIRKFSIIGIDLFLPALKFFCLCKDAEKKRACFVDIINTDNGLYKRNEEEKICRPESNFNENNIVLPTTTNYIHIYFYRLIFQFRGALLLLSVCTLDSPPNFAFNNIFMLGRVDRVHYFVKTIRDDTIVKTKFS